MRTKLFHQLKDAFILCRHAINKHAHDKSIVSMWCILLFSILMIASTREPGTEVWLKLHLFMQHFLVASRQACSLYIVPSLGYVITLPRTTGTSPSVATQDYSAFRGVCSPHAAMLLPHDMLKVYMYGSGKRKAKPRKHGRWSAWIPGFMSGWILCIALATWLI